MNISKINANQIVGFQGRKQTSNKRAAQNSKFDAFVSSPKTKKAVKIAGIALLVAGAVLGGKAILNKINFKKAVKAEALGRIAENNMPQKDKIARALPNAVQNALDVPVKKGEKIGNTAAGIRLDGLTHANQVEKQISHLEDVDAIHRARHMGLIQAFKSDETLSRANFDEKTAERVFNIELNQLNEKIQKAAQKAQPKA